MVEPNPFQYDYGQARRAQVTASHPAGVSIDPKGEMEKKSLVHTWGDHVPVPQMVRNMEIPIVGGQMKGVPQKIGDTLTTDYLLEIAETGLPIGPAGAVIGAPFGFINAQYKYNKQRQMVLDEYREEIAEQLDIDSNRVDENAMEYAARTNKSLHRTLDALEEDKEKHPWLNMAGLVGAGIGAFVLGSVGVAITALGPLAVIGGLVGSFIGFSIGYPLGTYIGKNVMDVDDQQNPAMHIDNVIAKQMEGEKVTALDIFKVRIAQNPYLYEAIKNQYGEPFHALSERGQLMLMRKYDALTRLCAEDAFAANQGVDAGRLMIGRLIDRLGPTDHAMQAPITTANRVQDHEGRSFIADAVERVDRYLEEDEGHSHSLRPSASAKVTVDRQPTAHAQERKPVGKWTEAVQRGANMRKGDSFVEMVKAQQELAARQAAQKTS